MAREAVCLILALASCISVDAQVTNTYIAYQTKEDCSRGNSGQNSQFFDSTTLQCTACSQTRSFQRTSPDGLTCVCQPGYYFTSNLGGTKVTCAQCNANQAVVSDGWECATCPTGTTLNNATGVCEPLASDNAIQVGRELSGRWTNNQPNQLHRQSCATSTMPNLGRTRCDRCTTYLALRPGATNCTCAANRLIGGWCFPDTVTIPVQSSDLFTIPREAGGSVVSQYLTDHVVAAIIMCQELQNLTACQALANMCAMLPYYLSGSSSCDVFKRIVDTNVPKPFIFYTNDGFDVVYTNDLPEKYTFNPPKAIDLISAQYSLNGTFLGFVNVTTGLLQLCEGTESIQNAAFRFGTSYSSSCTIPASRLWDQNNYPLIFNDIYLKYVDNQETRLHRIPLVVRNLRAQGRLPNEDRMTAWQMTQRFFMVDNFAAITTSGGEAEFIRYAQSITLEIRLREDSNEGQIYIPYLSITYAEVDKEDRDVTRVSVDFSVHYEMNQGQFFRNFQIACGTLGTLAVFIAGYHTWVWSKRAGRIAIDFACIVNFIFYICAALSNALFVITFGISFYWLLFFKLQSTVFLLHLVGGSVTDWEALVGSAFALRLLAIVHLIVSQCMADVFLIDWERPRGFIGSQASKSKSENPGNGGGGVSIWRTYFVANEWNELQTVRKINPVFQLFAVVFFLSVVGFENVATIDPDGSVAKGGDVYIAVASKMFRYAVAALIYLLVALVQWVFFTFIYERFVEDQIRQFVDLCSMSNISLFIMSNSLFGYYIHGRSVHGKADTDMREMHEMMKKEEDDMCGQRGLMPNTDQQTFEMALPRKLRVKYDQVYCPAALEAAMAGNRLEQGKGGSRIAGTAIEKQTEAYNLINKFLGAFIDHSLKDVDYVVKDKTILESIMTTEFLDPNMVDKGFFYNDNGHSFDQVLFYGHEISLLLFDILFFCIVDVIAQNFILSGCLTYLAIKLVKLIRENGGKRNLAKKTLVDDRFLI